MFTLWVVGRFIERQRMIIDAGVQANCSEATMRIKIGDQDEAKIDALIAKLNFELSNEYSSIESSRRSDWDGEKEAKEFDFSEAYVKCDTIFGTSVLEISGDAPYNMGDDMEKLVRRYLPKAEIEWSE
jgi:hypothetical protein